MARPRLSFKEAQLHGMRPSDIQRSRSKETPAYVGGKPKFPAEDLPAEAAPVWKAIVKDLGARGTLTKGDRHLLTLYCGTFLQWRAAIAAVAKAEVIVKQTRFTHAGTSYEVLEEHPGVKLAAQLADRLQEYLRDMGLTGKDRIKVEPVAAKERTPDAQPGTYGYAQARAAASAKTFAVDDEDLADEADAAGLGISDVPRG